MAAKATAKPAPTAEDQIRIMRKYQTVRLTDEQIAEYLRIEAQEEARKEQRERDALEAALRQRERDAMLKKSAGDLVSTGRILISCAGLRVETVTGEGMVSCTHCGSPLPETAQPILDYTDLWVSLPPGGERYSPFSPLMMLGGGRLISPVWMDAPKCKNCGNAEMTLIQLIVV